jgi:hypothetical protein
MRSNRLYVRCVSRLITRALTFVAFVRRHIGLHLKLLDAVVFVVDASDTDRLGLARADLRVDPRQTLYVSLSLN